MTKLSFLSPRAPVCLSTALGSLLAVAALMPGRADACGAPYPELSSSIPASGDTHPANAALVFQGFSLALTGVSVTVDGVPAQLVETSLPAFSGLVANIEPRPEPGQAVVISGNFCEGDTCEHEISFTAGPNDDEAPVAKELLFAAYDHADFVSGGGDCMSDSDLTLYVHADVSPQADGQAAVRYRVTSAPGMGDFESGGLLDPDGPSVRSISLVESQLGGVAPTDLCVSVELVDLAGNAGEPIEVCKPCFFRTDDSTLEVKTPDEPAWTEADVVPGSACAGPDDSSGSDSSGDGSDSNTTGDPDTGDVEPPTTGEPTGAGDESSAGESGDTADEQDGDKGCGCRGDNSGGQSAGLMLGVLALLARRRRQ